MTPGERIMLALDDRGGATVGDLAADLPDLSRGQLLHALDRLQSDGRVRRVRYGSSGVYIPTEEVTTRRYTSHRRERDRIKVAAETAADTGASIPGCVRAALARCHPHARRHALRTLLAQADVYPSVRPALGDALTALGAPDGSGTRRYRITGDAACPRVSVLATRLGAPGDEVDASVHTVGDLLSGAIGGAVDEPVIVIRRVVTR